MSSEISITHKPSESNFSKRYIVAVDPIGDYIVHIFSTENGSVVYQSARDFPTKEVYFDMVQSYLESVYRCLTEDSKVVIDGNIVKVSDLSMDSFFDNLGFYSEKQAVDLKNFFNQKSTLDNPYIVKCDEK